jgi:hypothetical protein
MKRQLQLLHHNTLSRFPQHILDMPVSRFLQQYQTNFDEAFAPSAQLEVEFELKRAISKPEERKGAEERKGPGEKKRYQSPPGRQKTRKVIKRAG